MVPKGEIPLNLAIAKTVCNPWVLRCRWSCEFYWKSWSKRKNFITSASLHFAFVRSAWLFVWTHPHSCIRRPCSNYERNMYLVRWVSLCYFSHCITVIKPHSLWDAVMRYWRIGIMCLYWIQMYLYSILSPHFSKQFCFCVHVKNGLCEGEWFTQTG